MPTPDSDAATLLAGYAGGAMAMLLLAAGERSGLLDGLATGPADVEQLAARTGSDARNVAEWVAGMSAAGLLEPQAGSLGPQAGSLGPQAGSFALPAALAADTGRALVRAVAGMCSMVPAVADAVRSGAGIAPDVLAAAYAPNVWHMNDARYRRALIGWVEQVDGLPALLGATSDVHEIGTGSGAAVALLAEAYPAARFVGHDPAPAARRLAADRCAGLPNVRIVGQLFAGDPVADVVLVLDTLHHLGNPAAAVAGWAGALRPGGMLVIAEPTRAVRPAPDPDTVAHAASALFYCMQDGLRAGGAGHGDSVPADVIQAWTRAAGLLPVPPIAGDGGMTLSCARKPAAR